MVEQPETKKVKRKTGIKRERSPCNLTGGEPLLTAFI